MAHHVSRSDGTGVVPSPCTRPGTGSMQFAGDERRLLHEPLPGVDDDLSRAERLALRDVRRTRRRAAAASVQE